MKQLISLCLLIACICSLGVTGVYAAAEDRETIELTAENFFDYYELVQEDSVCKLDSKGKIQTVNPGPYVFVLKEEYQGRCEWKDEDVTVAVKGTESYCRVKIDGKTGEITLGKEADKDIAKALKKTIFHTELDGEVSGRERIVVCQPLLYYRTNRVWMRGPVKPTNKIKLYMGVWDVDVVSVSGTICLKPEA